MASQWFNFTLGFSDDGPDGDSVRHVLSTLSGCNYVVNIRATGLRDNAGAVLPVNGVDEVNLDVVVGTFEQADEAPDYPMFLTGWAFDADNDGNDYKGAPVRIPLANSRITIL
jgi:hypothetical protein